MQAIKFSLPGRYWDVHLYSGFLYLFHLDGTIITLAWDQMLDSMPIPDEHKLAFDVAFRQSHLLYKKDFKQLSSDPDFKTNILNSFKELSSLGISLDNLTTEDIKCQQDNPFPFPHADLEVYNNRFYLGAKGGLFQSFCDFKAQVPLSSEIEKLADNPSLSIAASYGNMAIAGGDEGLFELELEKSQHATKNRFHKPFCLYEKHCGQVDWNYYSIFGSSVISGGFLAYQETGEGFRRDPEFKDAYNSIFEGEIIEFEENIYSWGCRDKIYSYNNGAVNVKKFNPFIKNSSSDKKFELSSVGTYTIASENDVIISARTAPFGTILEFDEFLCVFKSDNSIEKIKGEPTQWKVYPRSTYYENQLHVIHEDRIDFYSFNHDPFVLQNKKPVGYYVKLED